METFCGSPCYVSPEMILRKKYKATDIDSWGLGVILYYLLAEELPFQRGKSKIEEIYESIVNIDIYYPQSFDEEMIDFFDNIFV